MDSVVIEANVQLPFASVAPVTTATPRPIIFDTDPGQDDAIAILTALASPELDVLGISCVAGNVPLDLTVRNARLLCELAGRTDMAIYAGCSRPMVRSLVTAEEVHGQTGIDGPEWGEPTMPISEQHAVPWIVETLLAADDGSITICPVGPLTNVALAMVMEPAIIPKIREIVLMGGAYWEGGNTTPVAEFNIYVDPQAAHVVFTSGAPIVAIPLDVTHKALMSDDWIASLDAMGTDVGHAASAMCSFYERYDEEKYGTDGGPLHDPNVIAYLLEPELYSGKHVHVAIEHNSETSMGQTLADWWGVTGNEPNCHWITDVDSDGFYQLLTDRLGRYT